MKLNQMKTHSHFPLCFGVLLAVLASGTVASAQSGGVPGPTAYSAFGGFIATRNIFDPNRYQRNSGIGYKRPYTPRPTPGSRTGPAFTLVGTMAYEKGMFAFFDGNSSDLRKVLYLNESNSIAGFTVQEITLTGVKLQTADKKQTLQMKIGDVMRQDGNGWRLAGQGELFAGTTVGTTSARPVTTPSASAAANESSSPDASAAPSPALEQSDILKKLMQQRQQELK
jgi:hypothetical protein